MSILEVKNLCKSYGNKDVLKDICLTIQDGETIAILGENGAGKTTLIECIEGIRKADAGEIIIDGKTSKIALDRGIIGVQTQIASFPPEMKVKEVMDLVSLWNDCQFDSAIINTFNLAKIYNLKYGQLSIGWKRKLHLAVSLFHQPKVIFLDEPTAGLDVQARNHFHQLIKRIQEMGKTIIITSHDMAEIELLCDRVCFINNGKIIYFGTIKDLKNTTTNGYKLILEVKNSSEKMEYYMKDINNEILDLIASIIEKNYNIQGLKIEEATLEEKFIEMIEGTK